jgi:hypothetical protein
MTYSGTKWKSNGDKTSVVSDHSELGMYQVNVYLCGFYYRFCLRHFNQPNYFRGRTKFNEDVVQYFPPESQVFLKSVNM